MSNLDLPKLKVVERMVLKKFDGPIQTDEHLLEMCIMEDGKVIDYWCRPGHVPEESKIPPRTMGAINLTTPRREDG